MSESPQDIASIFFEALELEPAARDSLLRSRDKAVQHEVVKLLKLYDQASGFLSRPVISPESGVASSSAGPASVLLALDRQADVTVTPVALPRVGQSAAATDEERAKDLCPTGSSQRYQIQGEIARGGMGAILKGRDIDLGRNLAVKVLLENHRNDPDVIRRFIEEAQIGGQLQHPGIVPVYELGTMDDRPFFTMKLIKGQTLSALLRERKNPEDERGRFVGIFEQICQTLAYAHSRRVIHRDLKPSNIMVGDYGEVQVMDWGLAKVMPAGGIVDEKKALESQKGKSIIQTLRSAGSSLPGAEGSGGSETQAGSVMGTLAYMPPEQALGEVDLLDERADVFGLGAILCEILTGKPPYVGKNATEIHRLAARGKTDAALERLSECGADPGVVSIATDCLNLEPKDRPRDAGVLSNRLIAFLESVETRLRETEVQRASEAIRVEEDRKRYRLMSALAACVVLVLGMAGTGTWWFNKQRMERHALATEQVRAALSDARLQQGKAEGHTPAQQVPFLQQAVINAKRAVEVASRNDVGKDLQEEATDLLAVVTQETQATKSEATAVAEANRLQAQLERIRLNHAEGEPQIDVTETDRNFDARKTHEAYQVVFKSADLDVQTLSIKEAASKISQSRVREPLIAAIDHWSRVAAELALRQPGPPESADFRRLAKKLNEIGDAADDNQWRKVARTALTNQDLAELKALAASDEITMQPPEILAWLGEALRYARAEKLSAEVLADVQGLHPDHFWINYQLAKSLLASGDPKTAIGYARAALSARPDSPAVKRLVIVAFEKASQDTDSQLASGQTAGDFTSGTQADKEAGNGEKSEKR